MERVSSAEIIPRLGRLKSGEVVRNRPRSHIDLSDVRLVQAITETLPDIESGNEAYIVHSKDFGHPIGESKCVETGVDEVEPITYAKRKGRSGYTRFIRDRVPVPVSECTVVLKKDNDNDTYVLITAYLGPQAAPEPWDSESDETARHFWSTHALIWDPDVVDLRSVTNRCPW